MKLKTTTISCSLLVAATFFIISGGLAKLMCPEIVTVEEGRTANVSCDTTGKRIVLVFWYIGDPAISSPILQLKDGKPGGTEYEKGHYSITSSGGIIITNATIKHENVYTILLYYQDETRENMSITVNVTISPRRSCPVINECIPCKECSLAVKNTGKLVCSIIGTRPMIALKWTTKTQEGVRILEHPPVAVNDVNSDTWNSSVEVSYGVLSCNQEATLKCEAEDIFKLLTLSQSSVRIYTANCTNDSLYFTPAKSNNTKVVVAVFSGSIFVISTMFLFAYIYFKVRRKKSPANGVANSSDEETLFLHSKVLDADAQELASLLKEKYKARFLYDSSPKVESRTAAKLFAVCNYKVEHANGETSVLQGNTLLKGNDIKNESRVLLTGEPRYWKTIFIKQFVQQWVDDTENDFILLFITKSEVRGNVNLVELLEQKTSLDRCFVTKVLENNKCILLVDGIDNIASDENETNNAHTEPQNKNDEEISTGEFLARMTFSDLCKRTSQVAFHSEFQIWATTWHKDTIDGIFELPHTKVCISDVVSEQQFDKLIEKVYEQNNYFRSHSLSEKHGDNLVDGANTRSKTFTKGSQNEQSKVAFRDVECSAVQSCTRRTGAQELHCDDKREDESNQREIDDVHCNAVSEFLKKNQIYQLFKEAPFLLSLMLTLIIETFLPQHCDFDDKETTTLEELICAAIRHLQEAYCVIHEPKVSSIICHVDATLGRVALHHIGTKRIDTTEQSPTVRDCGDNLNLAIEMGIIQFSKSKRNNQPEEKNTESSPSHCFKCIHVYFMFYFAANYIVENKEYYKELAELDESKGRSISKFLVLLEKSSLEHLVLALQQFKMNDYIIDCLSRWKNKEDVDETLRSLGETEIQVCHLDRKRHHTALISFLTKCIDMEIELSSLVIRGNFAVSSLTSIEIPVIKILTLRDRRVQEKEFISILRWLSNKEMTLRFQNCDIKEELSEDVKREVKELEDIKVKTVREGDAADCTTSTFLFNYKNGKWSKEEKTLVMKLKDILPSRSNIEKILASYEK